MTLLMMQKLHCIELKLCNNQQSSAYGSSE